MAQAVTEIADQGLFDGVVLIAHAGGPIWQGAFGQDGTTGGPMRLDTQLNIASVGKMFTAVAVAQLVEDGRLSFEDTVDTYVPDLPTDVGQATIGGLLSHTAGLEMNSMVRLFEPGDFHYSNAGFDLLALVVESVTDRTFAEYVHGNVFGPAGMEATAPLVEMPRGSPSGSGGQLSTAGDLLRFANALSDHQLIDESTTAEITSPKVSNELWGYGYGFAIFTGERDEVPSLGHIGALAGIVAAVEINPTLDYTLIVLCNRGFDDIEPALTDFQIAIGMGYWRG